MNGISSGFYITIILLSCANVGFGNWCFTFAHTSFYLGEAATSKVLVLKGLQRMSTLDGWWMVVVAVTTTPRKKASRQVVVFDWGRDFRVSRIIHPPL